MTELYLIRHSEPIRDGVEFINTSDFQQERNEKGILSVRGEEKAKYLSEQDDFKNIDYVFSSGFSRAMSTAKYIAFNNNKKVLIDDRLGERLFGVKEFSELPERFEWKQLENHNYKMPDGESFNEVKIRMKNVIEEIVDKYKNTRIVALSHATAITCFLLNYVDFDIEKKEMYFKGNKVFDFSWDAPEVFKLTFDNNELIDIKNIKIDYV
ncbi:MAG: histidine phosphatase family protein [Bacilli bacterium]|nr:histidine phosphatase family protein [Bacilli bacterium]